MYSKDSVWIRKDVTERGHTEDWTRKGEREGKIKCHELLLFLDLDETDEKYVHIPGVRTYTRCTSIQLCLDWNLTAAT